GTSGTSTQGAWGYNPAGIRIGQGISRNRRAVQVAERRAFKNYSGDRTLDTRQMKVALSHLRSLLPAGEGDKLDIHATIDATCKNAGEIELVWEGRIKKGSKVILFMDTGGSMTPYAELVDQLFSAAAAQISRFRHFYFHNCIYQDLRTDMEGDSTIPTLDFFKAVEPDYKVIIVALPPRRWDSVKSILMIRDLFPMFELTLEGLDDGIRFLIQGKTALHQTG
ncbi:MAG: VWA domain-containing protein, partial [Proteobacteria bacterium]|nr:VWA domain-containing protein [Pseudomonadota bacterium]